MVASLNLVVLHGCQPDACASYTKDTVYISEDFHHVDGVEAFTDFDHMLKFANEQLVDQEGYFFVIMVTDK